VSPNGIERLGDGKVRLHVHVAGGHEVAGAGRWPLLDLADLLGRLRVHLLEGQEELVADGLRQDAEEVGAVVAGHLAGDVGDRLGRHELDELLLLVVLEALEDGGRVLCGHPGEHLCRLLGLQLADEVGKVLGVDLREQLADLLGILLEDLLHIGAEERADTHDVRPRV
jgi:hypothetical protein